MTPARDPKQGGMELLEGKKGMVFCCPQECLRTKKTVENLGGTFGWKIWMEHLGGKFGWNIWVENC